MKLNKEADSTIQTIVDKIFAHIKAIIAGKHIVVDKDADTRTVNSFDNSNQGC